MYRQATVERRLHASLLSHAWTQKAQVLQNIEMTIATAYSRYLPLYDKLYHLLYNLRTPKTRNILDTSRPILVLQHTVLFI